MNIKKAIRLASASMVFLVFQSFTMAETKFSLLRFDNNLPDCYQHVLSLVNGTDVTTSFCQNKMPYWNLYTVGWPNKHQGTPTGWDAWFIRNNINLAEVDLRQSASSYWSNKSPAIEETEPTQTKRCALREVGMGFDWVDSGLRRLPNGKEPTLADFSAIYFGAYLRTSANNVVSSCDDNPHHFLSLDFIYEYEVDGKVVQSNAIHLIVSKMNHKDSYGNKDDDILYQNCYVHPTYHNKVCSVLVDASKWGINTIGNNLENDFKNVNAEFLLLIKNLEGRKMLNKCSNCEWNHAKIRHLQIVNSVRGGARYTRVKDPFALGILKKL